MSNLEASYKLILNELRKISNTDNFYFKPITPKLSDIELISLIILAEYKSIDSECQLFREIKGFEIEFDEKGNKKLDITKYHLTSRQVQIIELIRNKKSNKEIADLLFISENTVKYHLKAIYEILGIEHRVEIK